MEIAFSPRTIITNPNELFGREDLLNQLISLANNRYCVSITGLRRFGKTSLLKCVETILKNEANSKAYPIYFDFKNVGSIIKGTDNTYRYMIANLVSDLTQSGYFEGETSFSKITIKSSNNWKDIYEDLKEISSVRIQGLLEEIIVLFSDLIDKSILFLIDEYEWLFRFSFDNPVGFMKLRTLSSTPLQNGKIPFCFWISGAISWDYLCSLTGSGELNVIDGPPIYLSTIENESFQKMWENECRKIENDKSNIKEAGEFVFQATGGIPFYGKVLGGSIISTGEKPSFLVLKSYFKEMLSSLQNEEIQVLNELAKSPRTYKNSKFIIELSEKGLIKMVGRNYEIQSAFFREYINSTLDQITNLKIEIISESHRITDRITGQIININNTFKNKTGKYIFEPVNDDAALFKDLRTPCYSLELFSDFASSLYKIVFEKTKENKNGIDITKARFPNSYKKDNKFIEIVDILRHSLGRGHIMDSFTQRQGQMTKVQMLKILTGNINEPNSPDDLYNLQISILKLFESELIKLNTIVRLMI